jgi:hypothetical protein
MVRFTIIALLMVSLTACGDDAEVSDTVTEAGDTSSFDFSIDSSGLDLGIGDAEDAVDQRFDPSPADVLETGDTRNDGSELIEQEDLATDSEDEPDGPNPCVEAPEDSDHDGLCDRIDRCEGFNDLDDRDDDGIPDACDACPVADDNEDEDGNGIADSCDCSGEAIGCGSDTACFVSRNGPICICASGFGRRGAACEDIDECLGEPCSENANCTNVEGSYTCEIFEGYEGIAYGDVAEDINECNDDPCGPNAGCLNTPGSFTCACFDGFAGDDPFGAGCLDLNECQLGIDGHLPCAEVAVCDNTPGNYTCTCPMGYVGYAYFRGECLNINECVLGVDGHPACVEGAVCSDRDGTYVCDCVEGYTGDSARFGGSCDNLNECEVGVDAHDACNENAVCEDTDGSFTCACASGFSGDGGYDAVCEDVDECGFTFDVCLAPLACVNFVGGYSCRLVLGESCAEAADCASGHCVGGICCDTACDGSCRLCGSEDMPGTCVDATPGTDPLDHCDECSVCSDERECVVLDEAPALEGDCTDDDICGHTGLCVAGACQVQSAQLLCDSVQCDATDPANPVVTQYACDGDGFAVRDERVTCNGFRCADETSCRTTCGGVEDCAQGYDCRNSVCTRWISLGGGVHGADLVSDGIELFRVGGQGFERSVYVYDGIGPNTWTSLTDANPQPTLHASPGEGNRAWVQSGRIIVAAHSGITEPGGNRVTIFNPLSDVWSNHPLPAFIHYDWGQGGVLNARSGEVYIQWSEDTLPFVPYATAALDVLGNFFGEAEMRTQRIGRGFAALEDSSSRWVFDLLESDEGIRVDIYDYDAEERDFTGSWYPSRSLAVCSEREFLDESRNLGVDLMAWDRTSQRLYIVPLDTGITLEYDPGEDVWREVDRRPPLTGFRSASVAVAGNYLYSQVDGELWALDLRDLR